jgi:proton-coupled amino acid transporter
MGLDIKRDQFRQLEKMQVSRRIKARQQRRQSVDEEGGPGETAADAAADAASLDADDLIEETLAELEKTSVAQTYFTFFKSFIGIGILALPHGFYLAGYVGGPAGMVFVSLVSYYCMLMLLDCRDLVVAQVRAGTVNPNFLPAEIREDEAAKGDLASFARDGQLVITYSDIGRAAMGSLGAKLVDFAIVSSQMGFSTAYLIFIGSNVQSALASCSGSAIWALVAAALVCPLVWLRSLRKLAFGAIFADAAILFGLVVILGFAFAQMGGDAGSALPSVVVAGTSPSPAAAEVGDTPTASDTLPLGDPAVPFGSSPFLFFGMAVFAFEGAGISLPMQQAMREPSEFKPILRNGMLVITSLYLVFPLITYVAWGSAIQDMVTANLPQRAPIVITVELLYCAGLFLTFPIMMWPAVQILEGSRLFRALECCGGGGNPLMQSIVFRTLLVAVVSIAAIFIPKFGLFVGLIGCLSCSMLAFILPAMFSLKLDHSERSRPLRWFMVGFGVIGGGISFVVTMIELVEAVAKDAEAGGAAGSC